MSAKIASPGGDVEDAEICDLDDCLYAVNFVPKEAGIHTVSVRHKDIHIPGSPFQFTVGPFGDTGAHRVHAGGPGLERATVNETGQWSLLMLTLNSLLRRVQRLDSRSWRWQFGHLYGGSFEGGD